VPTRSAERFVGTARRECLDWLLIRNERHLERVLTEFVEHYNSARPHRGIDLEVPVPRVPDGPLDGSVQICESTDSAEFCASIQSLLERNGPDYRGACCSVQFPQSRDA
jgi:hypothetical protein